MTYKSRRRQSLLALPTLLFLLALGCGGGGTKSAAGGTNGSGTGGAAGDTSTGTGGDNSTSGGAGTTGSAGTTGTGGRSEPGNAGTSGNAGVTGTAGRGGTTGNAGTTGSGGSGTSTTWQKTADPFPGCANTNTGGADLLLGPARGELYASGNCGLSKSTDNGATWNLIGDSSWLGTPVESTGFNDLGELMANIGIDSSGTGTPSLWRLTGGTWTKTSTTSTTYYRFILDKTGALIAVTLAGDVWRSTDHGASFAQKATNIGAAGPISGHSGSLYTVAMASNGDLYTGGEPWSGLYRSQDNGVTWAYFPGLAGTLVTSSSGDTLDANGYKDNLLKIAFNRLGEMLVSRNYQASSLQRLANGGGWVTSATGIDDYSKVHGLLLNPASGVMYASNTRTSGASGGGIFTSTDDGKTWRPFNTGYDTTLPTRSLGMGPDGSLYVMGKGSTVNTVWRTTGAVP